MFGSRLLLMAAIVGLTAGCVPPAVNQAKADYHTVSRTLPWTGGEKLWVGVPADVTFAPGPANTVQITGPNRYVQRIVVEGGAIRYDRDHFWGFFWGGWRDHEGIRIVVTTPKISDAHIGGSGRLSLGQLNQDSLDLGVSGSGGAEASGAIKTVHVRVSGSGWARLPSVTSTSFEASVSGSGSIRAAGQTEKVDVGVSGSGHADLGGLQTQDLRAHVSGSGSVKASPKGDADASVSGSGHVNLLTEPAHLTTHRSGSGGISHPGGSED